MGYYTSYSLAITPNSHMVEDILKSIRANENCEYALDTINFFINRDGTLCFDPTTPVRWYDYMDDMKALSFEFPKAIFVLNGNGEDSSDVWEERWQNGHGMRKEIEYQWGNWHRLV